MCSHNLVIMGLHSILSFANPSDLCSFPIRFCLCGPCPPILTPDIDYSLFYPLLLTLICPVIVEFTMPSFLSICPL